MSRVRRGPQIRDCVIMTEAETERVRNFIARVGFVKDAMALLGLHDSTFAAARGYGRMQSTTRERVLAALAREEAKL